MKNITLLCYCWVSPNLRTKGKGFIYNYSKVRSGGMFATAHFGYWKHAKRFAKTVRDAYKKGYNNFYSVF